MTFTDVFVGRLRKPDFDWANPTLELERKDIEFLTSSLMDREIFDWVVKRSTQHPSRSLDWGSTAVPVSRHEILELMKRWKTGSELPEIGDITHQPRLGRARSLETVSALPEDEALMLVTEEF